MFLDIICGYIWGTALPLAATVATGAIKFTANEVIPIGYVS